MDNPLVSALRMLRTGSSRVFGLRNHSRLANQGLAPIPALFYHRVADYGMSHCTLPSATFARQIEFLRRNSEVIDLSELQHRIENGTSCRRATAITFDDGYSDNCRFALPLLVRMNMPCTYFVCVDNIKYGVSFAHDLNEGFAFTPNTVDELRDWADAGVEIGLHARTHFDFSTLGEHDADEVIESEIISAASELADLIGRPIRYFAFPYGFRQHLHPKVIAALRKIGIRGYCSAYGAYNRPGQDPFHIRRIHGDAELSRFWNWMYFDPAKLYLDPLAEPTTLPLERPPLQPNASS